MACEKRAFPGKKSARKAVASMHNSVRVYRCDECGAYHVTKERNGKVQVNHRAWYARANKGKHRHGRMDRN